MAVIGYNSAAIHATTNQGGSHVIYAADGKTVIGHIHVGVWAVLIDC